MLFKS
jgi:hypothetical protein